MSIVVKTTYSNSRVETLTYKTYKSNMHAIRSVHHVRMYAQPQCVEQGRSECINDSNQNTSNSNNMAITHPVICRAAMYGRRQE